MSLKEGVNPAVEIFTVTATVSVELHEINKVVVLAGFALDCEPQKFIFKTSYLHVWRIRLQFFVRLHFRKCETRRIEIWRY